MKELAKRVVPAGVYRPVRHRWWRLRKRPAPEHRDPIYEVVIGVRALKRVPTANV